MIFYYQYKQLCIFSLHSTEKNFIENFSFFIKRKRDYHSSLLFHEALKRSKFIDKKFKLMLKIFLKYVFFKLSMYNKIKFSAVGIRLEISEVNKVNFIIFNTLQWNVCVRNVTVFVHKTKPLIKTKKIIQTYTIKKHKILHFYTSYSKKVIKTISTHQKTTTEFSQNGTPISFSHDKLTGKAKRMQPHKHPPIRHPTFI